MMCNRLTACVLAASLFAVPATTLGADREHQQIMADIRMLQEQTVRLQLLMASLDEALRQISAKMDTQADATWRAFADHRLVIDNVAGGVRIVREKLDDSNVPHLVTIPGGGSPAGGHPADAAHLHADAHRSGDGVTDRDPTVLRCTLEPTGRQSRYLASADVRHRVG